MRLWPLPREHARLRRGIEQGNNVMEGAETEKWGALNGRVGRWAVRRHLRRALALRLLTPLQPLALPYAGLKVRSNCSNVLASCHHSAAHLVAVCIHYSIMLVCASLHIAVARSFTYMIAAGTMSVQRRLDSGSNSYDIQDR